MGSRFKQIRRLAGLTACWSSCACMIASPLAAADRFPKPQFNWSRRKEAADKTREAKTPRVYPAGTPIHDDPRFLSPTINIDDSLPAGGDAVQQVSAEQPAKADRTASKGEATEQSEEVKVRLFYASSPWEKVLGDLAEKTESTLVMMDVPPGTYSRRDWAQHTRVEAVRILNKELEPKGYRILEKDQFLTVIKVHRQRLEYPRPEYRTGAAAAVANPQLPPAGHSYPRGQVQQVAHEESAPEAPAVVTERFSPKNRAALELSRQIHEAYAARSELVDAGSTGKPGFRIKSPSSPDSIAAPRILFEVEFDTENDEILIHAPAAMAARVRQLFERLDLPPDGENGQSVRFLAGDAQTSAVAAELKPVISQLAQFREGAAGTGEATNPSPAAPDEPRQPAVPGPGDPIGVVADVRGDVTVVDLPDVGLLIIGNERDVQAVISVIKSVESLAIGSLPSIELLQLQHVDSESLAALLNDVYTQLATLRSRGQQNAAQQKQVTVVPVVTPNAVLILAPGTIMDSVLDLAAKLDKPVDPADEIQLFRLKFAVASQVVTHITTLYPATTGDSDRGLRAGVQAVADIRTNTVIVQAHPQELAAVTRLIDELDQDASGAVIRQQSFPLKFAVATEVAQFLNQAIQSAVNPPPQVQQQGQGQIGVAAGAGTTQGPQEVRDSKAVVLEFLLRDETQERLIRSGLLSDIRVNAYPQTNSLWITAPEQSLPLIEAMIAVLDQPSSTVADFKVFTLKNADAVATSELLQQLFASQQQQQQQGGFGGQNQGALGLQIAGATDSSSSLVPLQFTPDARTNSIVAVGGPEALVVVEAIITRLDASDTRGRRWEVYRLRNTSAQDAATAIQGFLQQVREIAQIDPDRITTNQLLEQEVIVQPELTTNNLLISATPRYMDSVLRIARELDREPQQVVIQALIVEVQLSDDCEFGVELGFQDKVLFDRSNPTTNIPGFLFNNQQLGNQPVNPASVGSQGLSNFALGRTSSELGFGGLVLSASSESVSVLIRALQANSNVQVLSRPQILAVDNQIAEITVGQQVPRAQGVTVTNNIASPNVSDYPVGIILSVIPRITPEGTVIMEVIANKSSLSDQTVVVFSDAATGNTVTSPIINETRAQTTIKVPDGQTVVVGGMITSSDASITSKVPWLGDLPVIGHAFRYDQVRNGRTELLIFLTPRIVRSATALELVKQVESERMHYFVQDAEAMHGPLFGIPQPYGPNGVCPPDGTIPGMNGVGLMPDGSLPPGAIVPPLPPGTLYSDITPGVPSPYGDGYSGDHSQSGGTVTPPIPYVPYGTVPPAPMEDQSTYGGPVLQPPPIDPPTNSKKVHDLYNGPWYGRQPLPH